MFSKVCKQMRISLIYLRLYRSIVSSCKFQHRNLTNGNSATTTEIINEEEPWVDPYKKALPEKSYFY